jgi:hypothetical protein
VSLPYSICAFLSGILCWRLTFSHFFFRFSLILYVLHVMATFSDDAAAVINSRPRIFIFRLLPTCGSLHSPLVKELMSTGGCLTRCMRSLLFSYRHMLSRSFMALAPSSSLFVPFLLLHSNLSLSLSSFTTSASPSCNETASSLSRRIPCHVTFITFLSVVGLRPLHSSSICDTVCF